VAAGIDHVLTLKVTDRRNIIRYRFGVIGDWRGYEASL
jgi:hypothetical protein